MFETGTTAPFDRERFARDFISVAKCFNMTWKIHEEAERRSGTSTTRRPSIRTASRPRLLLLYGKLSNPVFRESFIHTYSGLEAMDRPAQLVGYDGRNHTDVPLHPDIGRESCPGTTHTFDNLIDDGA